MRALTLRAATAGAVLPLALVSLAACGDNSSSTVATDPAASSPATVGSDPSTDTAAQTAGQTVDPAAFLDQVKSAAAKITTATFDMTMDVSGEKVTATGAMDMTGTEPAVQMSMTVPGQSGAMELRMFGAVIYFQVPGQDGKFVKMDLSDPNGPLGGLGGTLGNLDPQAMMSQIPPGAFKKVTYVGTEDVNGQQLKHYAIVLDASAATSMLGDAAGSAASSLPKTLGYDLYLDDQGRMARFKVAMPKLMTMTMTYSGFGESVDIPTPAPSDITEMPSMPSMPGATANS